MTKKVVSLTDSTPSYEHSNETLPDQERIVEHQFPKGEEKMDLKEFKIHIENFMVNKLDFKFRNPGIEHAGAVLCIMAKYADKSFICYDENLEGDITKGTDFYDHIQNFLGKGGKLSIITKVNPQENDSKNTLLRLKEQFKGNVELSYINPDALSNPNFDLDLLSNCFTVIDETGYRDEYDFPNRKAFFNFNDRDESRNLSEKFEKIKPFTLPI